MNRIKILLLTASMATALSADAQAGNLKRTAALQRIPTLSQHLIVSGVVLVAAAHTAMSPLYASIAMPEELGRLGPQPTLTAGNITTAAGSRMPLAQQQIACLSQAVNTAAKNGWGPEFDASTLHGGNISSLEWRDFQVTSGGLNPASERLAPPSEAVVRINQPRLPRNAASMLTHYAVLTGMVVLGGMALVGAAIVTGYGVFSFRNRGVR